MRVLIITQFYDPEPESFPHQFARGMLNRGHQVTVITGFPNYPYGKIFTGYRQKIWQKEERDGVSVVRLPLFPDRSSSSIKRSAYYLTLAFAMCVLGPWLCGPIDVIWVYHTYTLGVPAWLIGLLHRAPFIFNVQDMYPESLSATGLAAVPKVLNGVAKLADFVYERASAITVISPGFKKDLINKGVSEEKIRFIPNWANENIYCPVQANPELAKKFGMSGRFNIVYGGNFGPPQGLSNVIEAASRLVDYPEIQFVLIGDGLDRLELEQAAKKRCLSNVRFLPKQPESKMPSYYALADVLLVHLIDDSLFAITIPSKMQCYLACGKPLLMCVNGDAADIVTKEGAGIAVRPSEPSELAAAVKRFYAMPKDRRQSMGDAGRVCFLRDFTSDVVFDRYHDLFREVVQIYRRQ